MSRPDMRLAANKAIARQLRLHGDITLLQLEVRELKKRIRLARKELTGEPYGLRGTSIEEDHSNSRRRALQALRRPLSRRARGGK